MVRVYVWAALAAAGQAAAAWHLWVLHGLVEDMRRAVDAALLPGGQALVPGADAAMARLESWTSAPMLVTGAVSLVLLIGWLHSAAVLVERNTLGPLRHSPRWAIFGWFVPVLNVIRVPAIATDVLRAGRGRMPIGLVVGLWQFAWIGGLVLPRIAVGAMDVATSPRDFANAMTMAAFSVDLWVAFVVLSVVLVALGTVGLASTMRLTTSPYEFEPVTPSGFPEGHWGRTVAQPSASVLPAPPTGAAVHDEPVTPNLRFGTPAPQMAPIPAPTTEVASPYPQGGVFYPQQ